MVVPFVKVVEDKSDNTGPRLVADNPGLAAKSLGKRFKKRPVVRTVDGEDAIAIRPIMHLALSYDHRAVDGAPAGLVGVADPIKESTPEAIRSVPFAGAVLPEPGRHMAGAAAAGG